MLTFILAKTISQAVADKEMHKRATLMGERIGEENGVEKAVKLITGAESFLLYFYNVKV